MVYDVVLLWDLCGCVLKGIGLKSIGRHRLTIHLLTGLFDLQGSKAHCSRAVKQSLRHIFLQVHYAPFPDCH